MYKLYFDGSAKGDKFGGAGTVIYKDRKRIWQHSRTLVEQPMSCNVAEYAGLINGLKWLKREGLENEEIEVQGDSKLVIMQMFSHWRIKKGAYLNNAIECRELLRDFSNIRGHWIPRERNEEADFLSTRYSF